MVSERKPARSMRIEPWLLRSPSLAILIVFLLGPLLILLAYSFYRYVPGGTMEKTFVLQNYGKFLTDSFNLRVLWNTIRLGAIVTATDIVHVPYRGAGPALTDLIAGQIPTVMANITGQVLELHRSGKLRMLAVAGTRRSVTAPELPTIAESGVKGYGVDAWFGLVAPAGLNKDIVAKINSTTGNALKAPDVKQRFSELGYEPIGDTPEQFAATIKNDIDKYLRIIKSAGIKPEN